MVASPELDVTAADRIWALWPMGRVVASGKLYTLADCPKSVDTVVLGSGELDAQRGVSLWRLTQIAPQQSMISMIRKLQRSDRRVTLSIEANAEHPWESIDPPRLARTVKRELMDDWGFDGIHLHMPAVNRITGPRLFDTLRRVRSQIGPDREVSVMLKKTRGDAQEFLGHAATVVSMVAFAGFGRKLNERLHAFGRCARHVGPERVAIGVRPGAVTDRTSTPRRLVKKLGAFRPSGARKAGVFLDHMGRDISARTKRSDFAILHDLNLGRLAAQEAAETDQARERLGRPDRPHPRRRGGR